MTDKMPNIKRWSDAKLEKELIFGRLAVDYQHKETVEWINALELEEARRTTAPRGRDKVEGGARAND